MTEVVAKGRGAPRNTDTDVAELLAGLSPGKAEAVRELLREREHLSERYRRLVETTSDAILITDASQVVTFANPAAHALFGHPDARLLGMPAAALAAPEARDEAMRHEGAALGGLAQRYETVVLRANGERRTVSVSATPLREGSEVTGVVASLRDVTDERRARDAVTQSEARYRNLFETASDAIYTMDAHGAFTSVNQATCTVTGYTREELLGRNVRVVLDALELPAVRAHFAAALAGAPCRYECHCYRRDGERRLLSVTNTPIVHGGTVIGVLGVARDITEDRQREDALARSEARYLRLLESATDAIFTVDEEGRLTSVNRTLEMTIGRPREQILGTRFAEALDAKQLPLAEQIFRETLAGQHRRAEIKYRDAAGDVRIGSITTTPILEDGRVTGGLGIIRDVTEERRLAEELLQREKLAAIGQLVSGVAHELNNPLAGIMAFAQILQETGAFAGEDRDAIETIQKEAKRAARIVSNLLLFARQRHPERASTDVNRVIRDTLELRSYVLRTQGVEVVTELDPALPPTWADPFQLQQVFLNLITNAEQALRTHSGARRITLCTRLEEREIIASVSDTGPGIPPEEIDRIFNPFFTTKPVGEGTGLGLSISHGIVRQHGGTIAVRPTPGAGATFEIRLPLVDPPGAAPLPASAGDLVRPVDARAYLIVDDEPAIRGALGLYLQKQGHAVDTVATGGEAITLLRERRYDAIFLDLRMPDLGGEEVYTSLRESDPAQAARVVFATGDVESEGARRFLRGAGRPYVGKPFALAMVADLLARVGRG